MNEADSKPSVPWLVLVVPCGKLWSAEWSLDLAARR